MAENEENETDGGQRGGGNGAAGGPRPALDVMRRAGSEFTELTGLRAEAVTRLERGADGWVLETEVTELPRVPDTMSLMATYEVTTDPDGRVTGYRRVQRYERGRADRR
ncbi:gas vesicle protein [Streptomyces sp. URMC 129]|uniref:gas vesicle protein GvpO n=1 Tax=Streptomyces sp. URMC 129 TaxID=3423407 RepID=UPI003F198241